MAFFFMSTRSHGSELPTGALVVCLNTTALAYAQEAQRLAKVSANLELETQGLYNNDGRFSEIVNYCLERLADVSCWSPQHNPSWSMILLAHSLKAKEKLGIHKALQFIGDVCLMENDEVTAINLFTVALDGFTYMDVHRSRADQKNEDLLKALELWETARPLFECSSQAKRVQDIEERVGRISEEVKEQHQKNLARLAELNVPAGKVEEVDSDAEELELGGRTDQIDWCLSSESSYAVLAHFVVVYLLFTVHTEACTIVPVKFPEAHEGSKANHRSEAQNSMIPRVL
ncbi:hypothetical protein B0H16DRAFT_1464307 [Mycena metata]|uniref:Uncharacterized protein n=1 Tax=Mycena metata TaxID=1033252 RepID=A0AAD7IFG0_9AGAR|nr:hypothetical protein B0H16DRAFT_1464307 [Mycena metata]